MVTTYQSPYTSCACSLLSSVASMGCIYSLDLSRTGKDPMSNQLILIAAISFGLGGITGGLFVHMHEGKLNAYEQLMFDEQVNERKQAEESAKAQRESFRKFDIGDPGKALNEMSGFETKKKSK